MDPRGEMRSGAPEPLDALGAQRPLDLALPFHDTHPLEIWGKLAPGGLHRETSVVTEGRGFAAVSTLRHRTKFLSAQSSRMLRHHLTTPAPLHPGSYDRTTGILRHSSACLVSRRAEPFDFAHAAPAHRNGYTIPVSFREGRLWRSAPTTLADPASFDGACPEPFDCAQGKLRRGAQDARSPCRTRRLQGGRPKGRA